MTAYEEDLHDAFESLLVANQPVSAGTVTPARQAVDPEDHTGKIVVHLRTRSPAA